VNPEEDPRPQGQAGIHRRIAIGIASKAMGVGLVFGEQLFLVPVFLLYWGPEKYGDWLTLFSIAAFLSLADIGLQNYYANALHHARARGDEGHFQRLLHQGSALYLAIIASVGGAAIALLLLVEGNHFLNIGVLSANAVTRVLCLMGGYFLIAMPMGMMLAIYRAYGHFSASVNAGNFYRLGLISAIASVLILGAGPVAMASVYVLATIAGYAAILWHLQRRYSTLKLGISWPDGAALGEVFRTAPVFALVPLSMMLTFNGTVLLIAGLAGGGAVIVAYTTLRTLTSIARSVTNEIIQVAGVEIARQHAQDDADAIRRLYRFVTRLSGSSSGVIAGLIAIIGPPFLDIWTVGKVTFAPQIFWPLLAAAALSGPANAGMSVLQYINRPQGMALGYILSGVTIMGISLVLVPRLGAAGAAWAVLIAELGVLGIVIPIKTAAIVPGNPIRQIVRAHGFAAVGFGLSAGAAWVTTGLTGTHDIFAIALAGIVWMGIAAVPVFFLLFDAEKRAWILERVKQFSDRRR
jgi:O-antigen/teichoic acid export membrane protein